VVSLEHLTSIRPARQDDVDALLALHERVFPRPTTREHREWKLGGRNGPPSNVWVAEIDGRIVFQYAGIPVRVQHRGRERDAMVAVDAMTDPGWRRRGLLTQVSKVVYQHWTRAGVSFVLGMPNQEWGSRASALGWAPVAELRWWVRWFDPLSIVATKVGLRRRASEDPHSGAHISPSRDSRPFNDLWTRNGGEGVIKDATWFQWRYLDAPFNFNLLGAWDKSELVGGAAVKCDRRAGIIAEVLAPRFRVARALLARSCDELLSMGATRAKVLIQRGSMLEEAALATGFLPRSHVFSVQAVDLGGGLPRAATFQGGDFDVV
jgi:Acetyltransferase (GNAT) domain